MHMTLLEVSKKKNFLPGAAAFTQSTSCFKLSATHATKHSSSPHGLWPGEPWARLFRDERRPLVSFALAVHRELPGFETGSLKSLSGWSGAGLDKGCVHLTPESVQTGEGPTVAGRGGGDMVRSGDSWSGAPHSFSFIWPLLSSSNTLVTRQHHNLS